MNIYNLNREESVFFDSLINGITVDGKSHEETIVYYGKARREAKAVRDTIMREIELFNNKIKSLDRAINECDLKISFAMQYMGESCVNDGIGKIIIQKSPPKLMIDDTFNPLELNPIYYTTQEPKINLMKRDIISALQSGDLKQNGLSVAYDEHLRFY